MPRAPSADDWTIWRRNPVSREPSVPIAMTLLDLAIENDPVLSGAAGAPTAPDPAKPGLSVTGLSKPGPATRVPGGREPVPSDGPGGRAGPGRAASGGRSGRCCCGAS